MSKIPVPSGGFRSWLSANEGKPSKSVLYEQKYQIHHDRARNKENMSDNKDKSSSFVSMVNPRPTSEDYEKYDADRRLREKARDMRVAQRSASSSARNSFSMTPEPKEASPTNDQYFTPQHRNSSGLEEEFVTPTTSKKEIRKERRRSGSSDLTPLSTKPPRHRSSDQQAYYTTCLSRKMEENFTRMQDLVFSGLSMQEARDKTITEITIQENGGKSSRRSSRRSMDENIQVNRSSSQPPPIETLNMFPRLLKPESPMPTSSNAKETPILRTSYVDTLVATHQMQIQYADRIALSVEKQMTKLESMKNLAALSKAPAAEARKRRESEALRKLVETSEQKTKKLEVIEDIKERIEKITNVQLSIHQLVSSQPFEGDPYNERLLKSLNGWASLPFHEFDIQTAREMQVLHRKMMDSIHKFKNVAAMHRKHGNLNRSLNRSHGRKSIAMKILPSGASTCDSSSDSVKTSSRSRTEAATQVTARLAETIWTQTSPRTVGVEPLDLSSLEKANTSSQTTPTVTEVFEKSSTPYLVPTTSALTMTPTSTVADIDDMLNGIVLHNRSLETVEPLPHFKSDISYPIITTPTSEHSTPRSARVSLDSESARRLSAGVSNFLDQIKKENESLGNKEDIEFPPESSLPVTGTPVHIEPPVIEEEQVEVTSTPHNQSPTSNEESELELNVEDHDTTQFEHEMEEQEEQRRLRETAMTPTPPVEREQEIASEDYRRMTSLMDQEDEEDETKKFVNNEYFEGSIEDEPSGVELNDSADDSGFLLSNKPMPRLKSIFDNVNSSPPSSSALRADTPRSPQGDDSTYVGMDMEEYCRNDFLQEIGPIMIKKAIEFQNELRGLDWLSAQSVWKPPALEEMNVDHYDVFDMFDSFSILIWGAVVELINKKYLKFGRKMTEKEEASFEKEVLEMLQEEYGPESKKREWCREVKMSKKLSGMNPYELDYRYDVRRGLPDIEKQKYQRQQIQMVVIADRYPRNKLISEINEVYNAEKELLGHVILDNELEKHGGFDENEDEKLVAVSDV